MLQYLHSYRSKLLEAPGPLRYTPENMVLTHAPLLEKLTGDHQRHRLYKLKTLNSITAKTVAEKAFQKLTDHSIHVIFITAIGFEGRDYFEYLGVLPRKF